MGCWKCRFFDNSVLKVLAEAPGLQYKIPMQTTTIRVLISSSSGKHCDAAVAVEELNASDRMRRSIKCLGMCWGGAIVAVFLPILHFILVPLLLIAGPCWAYYVYQQEQRLAGGQGTCPDCNASLKIERGAAKWPLDEICTACRTMLRVDKK